MLDKHLIMKHAIEESKKCPEMSGNFSVGCVICSPSWDILSTGYTGEFGGREHAEQAALQKAVENGVDVEGAHLFCTLEPCGARSSFPATCSQLIIEAGISHVYYLQDEPGVYVDIPMGRGVLRGGGVVVEKVCV